MPDGKLTGVNPAGETWLHTVIKELKHHLLLFSGLGSGAMDREALSYAAVDVLGAEEEWVSSHIIISTNENDGTLFDNNGRC